MADMHEYVVDVKWQSGRKGFLSSPDLPIGFEVATPPQFPNGVKNVWSPEHLYTSAVASCLMTTFLAIAENSKLEYTGFSVKAKGIMEHINGKLLMTEVQLYPVIGIAHEKDRERAERIIAKSEVACLISNSIRSKVTCYAEIIAPVEVV